MRHQRTAHSGLHPARPRYDERHACTRFKVAVLTATQVAPRTMSAQQLHRLVGITIVYHRTIVACEDDKRIIGYPLAFQRIEHSPHGVVKLEDGIATRPHATLAHETGVWIARHMNIVRAQIKEEGPIGILFDELYRMVGDAIGNVLVLPACPMAALHVSDARYAIHNRLVVPMVHARVQLREQLGMRLSQRLALEGSAVAHLDGVLRVEPHHTLILHPHTRHTVARSRHDIRVVKSDVRRTRRNVPVPVLSARPVGQSQMPLAHSSRSISLRTEEVSHGLLLGTDNHTCIACSHSRIVASPAIVPRKQRIARGRTRGSHSMSISKSQTALRQSLHLRCMYGGFTVRTEVAIAHIISNEQYHIGAAIGSACALALARCASSKHRGTCT